MRLIESGVTKIPAMSDRRGYKHGDIYLYQLSEMTDESILRYGLTKYAEQYRGGKSEGKGETDINGEKESSVTTSEVGPV